MKQIKLIIVLVTLIYPLTVFSQNSIRVTGGNVMVRYFLSQPQSAYPTIQITGENNFSVTSTTNDRSDFVLETLRFPTATRSILDSVLAANEQRGNIFLNGGGYGNVQFTHQAAADKTNFVFNLEYPIRKFTPREQLIGVDAPFTMQGRVIGYAAGSATPIQLYATQIHGSGIAHLTFRRSAGFAGRQQRKIYLYSVTYEFTAN